MDASSETLKESVSKDNHLINLFLRSQALCLINNLGQILFLLCFSLNPFATFPHQFMESKSWREHDRSNNPDSQEMQTLLHYSSETALHSNKIIFTLSPFYENLVLIIWKIYLSFNYKLSLPNHPSVYKVVLCILRLLIKFLFNSFIFILPSHIVT